MTSKLKTVLIILAVAIVLVLVARFFFGGSEDTWICNDGKWVKHGNPSAPVPTEDCVAQN